MAGPFVRALAACGAGPCVFAKNQARQNCPLTESMRKHCRSPDGYDRSDLSKDPVGRKPTVPGNSLRECKICHSRAGLQWVRTHWMSPVLKAVSKMPSREELISKPSAGMLAHLLSNIAGGHWSTLQATSASILSRSRTRRLRKAYRQAWRRVNTRVEHTYR